MYKQHVRSNCLQVCVCVGACVGLMRYPGNCCGLCLNLSLICGLQSAQYIYLCVGEMYNLFTYVLLWCRMYLPVYWRNVFILFKLFLPDLISFCNQLNEVCNANLSLFLSSSLTILMTQQLLTFYLSLLSLLSFPSSFLCKLCVLLWAP